MSYDELNEIKKILEEHGKRISALEDRSKSKSIDGEKGLSIKEFILQKQPTGDAQKTLVIGYYLEHHKGFTEFNSTDLGEGFRETKEGLPTNLNRAIRGGIGNGHLMEVKQKKDGMKAWTLTGTGERYVENELGAK
ncbi:MAG TPA: hypothetical protein VIH03_00155 [Nitrososphaerales archaeon]